MNWKPIYRRSFSFEKPPSRFFIFATRKLWNYLLQVFRVGFSSFLLSNYTSLHISGTIHHDCHLCYTFENDNISKHFFHFFKILVVCVVSGVKEENMAQNYKKLWLLQSISEEPYMIWCVTYVSFMVHMCKVIISPGIFFIF